MSLNRFDLVKIYLLMWIQTLYHKSPNINFLATADALSTFLSNHRNRPGAVRVLARNRCGALSQWCLDRAAWWTYMGYILGFPGMGVPLNHPVLIEIFLCKPSSYWGTPMTDRNPHMDPYGYVSFWYSREWHKFLVAPNTAGILFSYKITNLLQTTGAWDTLGIWSCEELADIPVFIIPTLLLYGYDHYYYDNNDNNSNNIKNDK